MIAAKLIEMIEIHANQLTNKSVEDLITNARTHGFRTVPPDELKDRVFEIFHHLGAWIADPRSERIEAEFTSWGRRRFSQGIPLSEVICAVILLKQHLRRFIADNGLAQASFPRVEGDYVLPIHLQSLQDLNASVGQFFDEALYCLARGYEAAGSRAATRMAG